MRQYRAGVLIATHPLIEVTELTVPQFVGSGPITSFFVEERMPGINVSMTNVQENQTTGAVTLSYSSGNQVEYPSWADVGAAGAAIDTDPVFAEKLLALKAFRASPDGSNKTTQIGASVSCNGLADSPVVYTEPDN